MKKLIQLAFMAAAFIAAESTSLAQTAPTIAWDKTFGGTSNEILYSVLQTSDGGYIAGGYSNSSISGDKTQASKGGSDYWIVKMNASGTKLWDKTFGGSQSDIPYTLQQTSDDGYILGGYSLSGISGDRTHASRGSEDYWIVKLDSYGNKQWDKAYGGTNYERLKSIKQTTDGGYILAGTSRSPVSGDKTQPSRGGDDYWIIKVDSIGNKQWDKTFGGNQDEELSTIQQTSDGGYIIGGYSLSGISGEKTQGMLFRLNDYWIVKIDANGLIQWDKTFGGNSYDDLYSLIQTSDGGYLLGGASGSGVGSDKSQPGNGDYDYWILKLNSSGIKQWDKTYGGNDIDRLVVVSQTTDGGYMLGGWSDSGISGDKSTLSNGDRDFWLVKINSSGSKLWDKSIGGTGYDFLNSMQQTNDDGFIMGGESRSGIGADKSQSVSGTNDFWVVKLNSPCSVLSANIIGSCNNNNNEVLINITGVPHTTTSTSSWTLTYNVNGITQTITDTINTISLATNAAVGTVYSLVSISSGNCTNTLTGSFTVQAVPSAPSVTPGNNCGTGTVTISASGAPIGGNYIWYDTATAGNALQTSATGTFITPSLTASTPYFVAVTNNAGCESPRTQVMATINNFSVTAGINDTICESAVPIQLTGFSPTGGVWSGSGVSSSGLFTPNNSLIGNQTLVYSVTQNGCTITDTLNILVTTAPLVSAGINETVFVNSPPYQLTGFSPLGGTWSGLGVSATGLFTPSTALIGIQTLTYSFTQNGCTVTATKQITIPVPPSQPNVNLIAPDTLISSITGDSYEWKFNGNILSNSARKLKATASGLYAVRVINTNNGPSVYSSDFNFIISGLKDELQNNFNLYPNPTSGLLTIELPNLQTAEVAIFNAMGQQILQKTVTKTDKKVQLDLSKAATGIYLMQVKTGKQVLVKKIVVE